MDHATANVDGDQKKVLSIRTMGSWVVRTMGPTILGVAIAFLIGALIIKLSGGDPIVAYKQMVNGALGGSRQLTETALKSTPLLLIGLGLAVAFQARVWNIGGEGQFYIGALAGGYVALTFSHLPTYLLIPLMMIMGMLGGALWGLIPALLRIYRGINEIITTLMLNYVAFFFIEYMVRVPLRDPDGYIPESAQFVKAARLPGLFSTRLHIGVFLALSMVPVVYFLIWHTPIGFRLRAIGSKDSVARFAGINIEKNVVFALMFSGALAGLAGLIEVSFLHSRLKGGMSGGYGFTGILVALLGRLNPFGVLLASLFFTSLNIGSYTMHTMTQLPITLADTLQALMVLFVLGMDAYFRLRRNENVG